MPFPLRAPSVESSIALRDGHKAGSFTVVLGPRQRGTGWGADGGGLPISFPEYSPISVRQKGLGFKAAALSGKEAGKFDCA